MNPPAALPRLHALGLRELVRPVRALEPTVAFYYAALGFTREATGAGGTDALAGALAEAWGAAPRALARLRLGAQALVLAECPGAPALPDQGADDPRFQHIAIVTADIGAAWARVLAQAPSTATITQGGPVQLPPNSGGVAACKFRDPAGHPVELLAFAPGQAPARWRGMPGLTQGIDHSAITVADADRSITFYTGLLGLRQTARQTNHGSTQARLDGLTAPEVDVVALAAGEAAPHLELLGYRPPRTAAWPGATRGPRTCTVWTLAAGTEGAAAIRQLQDPDGHTLVLLPAAGTAARDFPHSTPLHDT